MSVAKRWVTMDGTRYTLPGLAKVLGVSESFVRLLKDAGVDDSVIITRARDAATKRDNKQWVVMDGVVYTLPGFARMVGVSVTFVRDLKGTGDPDEVVIRRAKHAVRRREAAKAWREVPYERDLVAQACVAIAVERGYGMTLDEIAEYMGMSKNHVQVIEARARDKMKAALMAEADEE